MPVYLFVFLVIWFVVLAIIFRPRTKIAPVLNLSELGEFLLGFCGSDKINLFFLVGIVHCVDNSSLAVVRHKDKFFLIEWKDYYGQGWLQPGGFFSLRRIGGGSLPDPEHVLWVIERTAA